MPHFRYVASEEPGKPGSLVQIGSSDYEPGSQKLSEPTSITPYLDDEEKERIPCPDPDCTKTYISQAMLDKHVERKHGNSG